MAKAKKDPFKEFIEKVWPQTKKEFEKAAENAKKMLNKGEEYLKDVSEKSVEKTKKMSLSLKKEKLYYDLGKAVATTPATKINSNKKVSSTLKEIKQLEKQIKSIK
tara:strand:+ start:641 stop:958 length:318 start_codon:yes stop_codon:yes gene_type:complete